MPHCCNHLSCGPRGPPGPLAPAVGFSASLSASVTLPADTLTTIVFDDVATVPNYLTSGIAYDTTSGIATVQPGIYLVSAQAAILNNDITIPNILTLYFQLLLNDVVVRQNDPYPESIHM